MNAEVIERLGNILDDTTQEHKVMSHGWDGDSAQSYSCPCKAPLQTTLDACGHTIAEFFRAVTGALPLNDGVQVDNVTLWFVWIDMTMGDIYDDSVSLMLPDFFALFGYDADFLKEALNV